MEYIFEAWLVDMYNTCSACTALWVDDYLLLHTQKCYADF